MTRISEAEHQSRLRIAELRQEVSRAVQKYGADHPELTHMEIADAVLAVGARWVDRQRYYETNPDAEGAPCSTT